MYVRLNAEKNTGEVDDRLHQLHQRYLLNDSGCRELTACMQTKLGMRVVGYFFYSLVMCFHAAAVVADIFKSEDKSTKVVNLQVGCLRLCYTTSVRKYYRFQDFVNRLVYRASTAALFNEALADDEELYQR